MATVLAKIESAAADQVKHQAVITLAAKIRDWQSLLFAVEDMIAGQLEFVAWWDEHVRERGGDGSNQYRKRANVAAQQQLLADEAEQLTGIKKWQVSRWRTALGDGQERAISTYRDKIIEAAQRRAGLRDKDPMAALGQPDRDGPDFWPTPGSLIIAAADHVCPMLPADARIWECAAGDGRLGYGLGAEIMTDKYPQDGRPPLDFLTDPPPGENMIAFTNQPFNASDDFIARGLQLLELQAIRGLVLLLRNDHFMAGNKVEALNQATFEIHCNWRPTWIPDTSGSPRWGFAWVYWGEGERLPPLYLKAAE